jgi:predicted nucleotidyltransferase
MVNIYKLKLTNLQQQILRLLFIRTGIAMNAHAIAKKLKVSQPAVSKSLPGMIKQEIITLKKDEDSGRLSIELNRENHRVMQLKRAENLKQIYESGLADFLQENFAGGTIILFGSYSRGDDTADSDIDIAVIGRKEKRLDMDEFETYLERKVNINFYHSFKDIHKNLKENLFNGIFLYGGAEL